MIPFHNPAITRVQCLSIITGASVMLSLGLGMRQSFGLFMLPMTSDIAVTAADFALAIAAQNLVWGLVQPFVGAAVDRYGARWVSVSGAAMFVVGLFMTSQADGPVMVWLGSGVLVGLAMACTSSGVVAKIAARVVRPERWSLAFGIISGAGSIGSFVAAPLAQSMIEIDGWRLGMIVFVALAAAMLPAALIGGRADRVKIETHGGMEQTLRQALDEARQHSGYLVMTTAFFVCGLQLVFVTTHLPTYLAMCGISPMVGAQALAVIGGFNIVGSILFGWLGDRYSRRFLLGFIYLLRSTFIALYFLLPASQFSTLLFAAAMGLLWLGVVPLTNGLIAQIFGIRFLATLSGVAFMSHQLGSFVGAWGGGLILEALGSYDLAWQLAVLIGVLAGIIQLFMDDRPTARIAAQRVAAT